MFLVACAANEEKEGPKLLDTTSKDKRVTPTDTIKKVKSDYKISADLCDVQSINSLIKVGTCCNPSLNVPCIKCLLSLALLIYTKELTLKISCLLGNSDNANFSKCASMISNLLKLRRSKCALSKICIDLI